MHLRLMRVSPRSRFALTILALLPLAEAVAIHHSFPLAFSLRNWILICCVSLATCALVYCVAITLEANQKLSAAAADKMVWLCCLLLLMIALGSAPFIFWSHRKTEHRYEKVLLERKELGRVIAQQFEDATTPAGPRPDLTRCDILQDMAANYRKLAPLYRRPHSGHLLVVAAMYEDYALHTRSAVQAAYVYVDVAQTTRTKERLQLDYQNVRRAQEELGKLIAFCRNLDKQVPAYYARLGQSELATQDANTRLVASITRRGRELERFATRWSAAADALKFLLENRDKWIFTSQDRITSGDPRFTEELGHHFLAMKVLQTQLMIDPLLSTTVVSQPFTP
ncbi:MAG: hypothetical protein ACR2IE_20470 [Candidatus Sumerlaeaceae bacterium]